MECGICHNEINPTDKFCGYCGGQNKDSGRDVAIDSNTDVTTIQKGTALNIQDSDLTNEEKAIVHHVIAESINPTKTLSLRAKVIIVFCIVFLIYAAYKMGKDEGRPLTIQEKERSIQLCKKWGGTVIADSNGEYLDCFNRTTDIEHSDSFSQ